MKTRIITSVVSLAALFTALFFYYSPAFNVLMLLATLLAVYEVSAAFKFEKTNSILLFVGITPFSIFLFLASAETISAWILPAAFATIVYYVVCVVLRFPKLEVQKLGGFFLYMCLILACFYSWIGFKTLLPQDQSGTLGLYFLGLSLCFAWGGDTMAYFAGVTLGKHKLAPQLSPKKTIEGAIGGIVGGTVLGLIYTVITHYYSLFRYGENSPAFYWYVAAIGVCATALGIIGDLFASAVKRQNDIKDYGSLFPGHGGLMDRFDSVMLVTPFTLCAVYVASRLLFSFSV